MRDRGDSGEAQLVDERPLDNFERVGMRFGRCSAPDVLGDARRSYDA